jgi:hypothetical protein
MGQAVESVRFGTGFPSSGEATVIGRSHWPSCWPANVALVADRIEDSNPTIFLSRYEEENMVGKTDSPWAFYSLLLRLRAPGAPGAGRAPKLGASGSPKRPHPGHTKTRPNFANLGKGWETTFSVCRAAGW